MKTIQVTLLGTRVEFAVEYYAEELPNDLKRLCTECGKITSQIFRLDVFKVFISCTRFSPTSNEAAKYINELKRLLKVDQPIHEECLSKRMKVWTY